MNTKGLDYYRKQKAELDTWFKNNKLHVVGTKESLRREMRVWNQNRKKKSHAEMMIEKLSKLERIKKSNKVIKNSNNKIDALKKAANGIGYKLVKKNGKGKIINTRYVGKVTKGLYKYTRGTRK